jgi:hypothetical protein
MMYFDKQNPNVLFGDKRCESITVSNRSHGKADGTRTIVIEPDMQLDVTALPFDDGTFRLVVFDPPHLARVGELLWTRAKYGCLPGDWRGFLCAAFSECFRVLELNGVLIFKWSEDQISKRDAIECAPIPPLFGHTTTKRGTTHWAVFLNNRVEEKFG